MKFLGITIGSIVALIGLAIFVLTIRVLRKNRVKSALTGIVFFLIGIFIVWLGTQGNNTIYINIGISDKQFGFLLADFVLGLFILKGVLDIREGSKNLQDKTISSTLDFKSKLQLTTAMIVTSFVIIISLVFFTQHGK